MEHMSINELLIKKKKKNKLRSNQYRTHDLLGICYPLRHSQSFVATMDVLYPSMPKKVWTMAFEGTHFACSPICRHLPAKLCVCEGRDKYTVLLVHM